jgi:hypothetical protein
MIDPMRLLTITIGEDLERALAEAPRLLDLASTSSAS